MKKQIDIKYLRQGMYVSELDRPWIESPFMFQGFVVDNIEDFKTLNQLCSYVVIDLEKGDDIDPSITHESSDNTIATIDLATRKREKVTVSFKQEIKRAQVIHQRTRMQLDSMFNDARMGKNIDIIGAKEVVSEMVESVVRNPDAQLWLTNLRKRDEYTAIHSMNVCIFALTFARYLGLTSDEMNELGVGALLHDIGKMRVPLEILNKEGSLTEQERSVVKQHAKHGYEILKNSEGIPAIAIEIAYSHHERKQGTGYPRGLSEKDIHLYARIVAIVDVYDAITSDRVYHHGMNTLTALENMFKWRESDFDRDLVESFIQCLGIYPIGSLVELNTSEVGIVLSMSQGRHLTPYVMLVCDEEKKQISPPRIIDLSKFSKEKTDKYIEIKKVLEANSYGVDVRDYIQHVINI